MSSLFSTVLTPAAYTLPSNQQFALALGTITLVNWTSDRSLVFVGLAATGGNVDGMVVCLSNLNNNVNSLTLAHDSSLASSPVNRFRNAGLGDTVASTGAGGTWYRYHGVLLRWIQIGGT